MMMSSEFLHSQNVILPQLKANLEIICGDKNDKITYNLKVSFYCIQVRGL